MLLVNLHTQAHFRWRFVECLITERQKSSQSDRDTEIRANLRISEQAFGHCCADGLYLGFSYVFDCTQANIFF